MRPFALNAVTNLPKGLSVTFRSFISKSCKETMIAE
jgi:hypothetical protein